MSASAAAEAETETTNQPKRPRVPRTPLDEARRALVLRYQPWALLLARKFAGDAAPELPSYRSAAMLGLVEAATNYDPSQGVRFATWAATRIRGACLDEARALGVSRRGPDAPRFVPLAALDDDESPLARPDPTPPYETDEAFDDLVDQLPQAELRVVCVLLYREGLALHETARRLNLSIRAVCAHRDGALAILREHLSDRRAPERPRAPLDEATTGASEND